MGRIAARFPERCRAARLSEDAVVATKPELARMMIERFLDAGHRVGRVTEDEVYGGNPKLRTALENHGVGYVVAVAPARPKCPPPQARSECPGAEGAEAGLVEALGRTRRKGGSGSTTGPASTLPKRHAAATSC